jgi:hypothetical protein
MNLKEPDEDAEVSTESWEVQTTVGATAGSGFGKRRRDFDDLDKSALFHDNASPRCSTLSLDPGGPD